MGISLQPFAIVFGIVVSYAAHLLNHNHQKEPFALVLEFDDRGGTLWL